MANDRILIVTCVFPPEPVVSAQIAFSLAEEFVNKNIEFTVIKPAPSRPFGFFFKEEQEKSYNFKVVQLNSFVYPQKGIVGRISESISFGIATFRYIRKHSNTFEKIYMNTWPLFSQFSVAIAARIYKKPYVIHIQDIYPESFLNKLPKKVRPFFSLLLMPIERYVLRNAEKVIAISELMKIHLNKTRKIQYNKISVIENWQDDFPFKEFQTIWVNGPITFMYLGNIGPLSGLDFVIEAYAKAQLVNSRFIIAGSGSKKQDYMQLVSKLNVTSIDFMDVPSGQVPLVQSQSHILVLPIAKDSGNTSIPSKLSAYMFSSRPILAITPLESDIYKIIEESNAGWVTTPDNIENLIQLFNDISILDFIEIRHKGKQALHCAEKKFAKEKNLKELFKLIVY